MPVENIFSTPIYYSLLDNKNIQEEISDCIDSIEFKMSKSWGNTHYLSDISFTENIIIDRKLINLKTEIEKHVIQYCRDIKVFDKKNFRIYSSWISLFNKNNYGHIHNHGYADISGVYYFQTSGEDGKIFFTSPVPTLESSYVYQQLGNRWEHKPMEGKLLLFPGWINHGIETNQTDNSRISISFNIVFDRI